MVKLTSANLLVALSLAAATTNLGAGCSATSGPVSGGESPDDVSTYPSIDGDARHLKAGPVLATRNDVARQQRLAYHRQVVDFHRFSYTLHEVDPSRRELPAITGYRKSGLLHPTAHKVRRDKLPAQLDQRGHGVVPPVRDQGDCGSCWAFGTTAAVESAVAIAGKGLVDLSEQLVVDCNGSGFGCGGGDFAFEVYKDPGGALENDYSYQASDGQCQSGSVAHPYAIDSFGYKESPTIEEMKGAIQQYGAVGVTMAVCGSFPGYSGGVYDSPECNGEQANHIVALVGWDDTVQHSQGQGVWILRNSWGTSWGDNGYAYVAYGMAGLEQVMTFAVYAGGGGGGSSSSSSGGSSSGGSSSGGSSSGGTGGSDPGGGGGAGGGGGGGGACDPCTAGDALDATCSPCVLGLCLADAYCCDTAWDDQCVAEAGLFCGCQ
jgi:C1A family cysteine protease